MARRSSKKEMEAIIAYGIIESYMRTVYRLEPADYDLSMENVQEIIKHEKPEHWCEWYAEKHNLTKIQNWTITKARKFMRQYLHVFINNEQNTYRLCPWAGTSTLIVSTGKFDLYRTDNYQYKKQEGYYIVENK